MGSPAVSIRVLLETPPTFCVVMWYVSSNFNSPASKPIAIGMATKKFLTSEISPMLFLWLRTYHGSMPMPAKYDLAK